MAFSTRPTAPPTPAARRPAGSRNERRDYVRRRPGGRAAARRSPSQVSDDLAKEKLRRLDQLMADRAPREREWQQIAELMNPMRADFTVQHSPGDKRLQKVFDGTAGIASENLVSGLWTMITNSANKWFEIRSALDELMQVQRVKLWCDTATTRMLNTFGSSGGTFYARVVDLY